jgi:hypothetical protein
MNGNSIMASDLSYKEEQRHTRYVKRRALEYVKTKKIHPVNGVNEKSFSALSTQSPNNVLVVS